MKYFIVLIFSLIFFSGCVSSKPVMTFKEKCTYYGFQEGSTDYTHCVKDEMHRAEDKNERWDLRDFPRQKKETCRTVTDYFGVKKRECN